MYTRYSYGFCFFSPFFLREYMHTWMWCLCFVLTVRKKKCAVADWTSEERMKYSLAKREMNTFLFFKTFARETDGQFVCLIYCVSIYGRVWIDEIVSAGDQRRRAVRPALLLFNSAASFGLLCKLRCRSRRKLHSLRLYSRKCVC